MPKQYIIAVDLGGTNLKIALLNRKYKIRDKFTLGTRNFAQKENLIRVIAESVNRIINNNGLNYKDILGMGLGVPGPVDNKKGIIHFFPNIPGWQEVALKTVLEKKLRLPVFLDNDANLMALAEYKLGAAKGTNHAVCLTLGTGVGGGIIIAGKLFRGAHNATGEIGHIPINEKGPVCNCGGTACLETYIGNNRILKEAQRLFKRDIPLEELSGLAKKKNQKARKIWTQAAKRLGIALAGIINLLNPDCIVIGGGMSNAGPVLFNKTRETINKRAMAIQGGHVRICKAKLGNNAGLIGAAIMVRENIKNFVFLFAACALILLSQPAYAQETKNEEPKEPIIVNGDVVEYSTDNKEVSATGNVSVTYKGTKLTCKKLTVNMETKVGVATGDARVEDKNSVIEGEKLTYNFQTKAGTIINANFRSNPYFGKGETAKKVSDAEFIIQRGYMTTCNYDNPHYRISSKKMDFFPNDKVLTKNNTVYIGKVPLAHIPQYNHSLKDPLVHVQLMPGKSKDWGSFLLTAWRYTFNDNLKGRIYADYREKRGAAEGFGLNYASQDFGKGDYKYYYTQERPRNFEEGEPAEFQRYFIRWRHKWDIDEQTNLISEYYKITDSKRALLGSTYSFLKDYFFREYEKDAQPVSYLLLHKNFTYSNMDFFIQKRTNRWYDPGYLEKIPEIKYNLSSLQIAETPLYFTNTSSAGNFNKKNTSTSTPAANDTNPDVHVNRLDTSNKLSLPMRVAFINLSPFVMNRETFYDKYAVGSSIPPRTVFYGGADASTKFYRIFNVKSNFLGMEINGLRHIITPSLGYAYNHEPTILNSKIKQIDGVDSITRSNSMSLQLYNKLQTKRNNQSVDFIDFRTTSTYTFKPKSGDKLGSNLSDILFELKLLPYSWMRLDADTTYMRSGNRSDFRYGHFSNVNYDLNFDFGKERSVGIGQRYQLKGGNEISYDIDWRLSPKWKFYFYQRYNRGHDPTLKRGLREQEYGISRDLHCWTVEFNYNVKRGVGEAVWFIFRLKAFPELEFEYNQNYHAPKPGSQSNP